MIIIKRWIISIISVFVFIRYKSIWNIFNKLHIKKKYSGALASTYYDYMQRQCAFVGIDTEFKNIPYFPHNLSGIFISNGSSIGKNCVIYQQVTIGSNYTIGSKHNGSPIIGDNCLIGAGAKIIGNVKIGNNVRIAAGCVVNKDVPDNSVVYGNPMLIKENNEPLDNRFIRKDNNGEYSYFDHSSRTFKKLKETV